MMRLVGTGCLLVVALLTSAPAGARPLSLAELYEMDRYLDCAATCGEVGPGSTYTQYADYFACIASDCGLPPRIWEKNGIAPVDRIDHELALMEYESAADPASETICYRDADQTIVVPGALCWGAVCQAMDDCTAAECTLEQSPEPDCEVLPAIGPTCWWPLDSRPAACPDVVCDANPVRSALGCSDADLDGLPRWLEDFLGLDRDSAESLCNASAACSFDGICAYDPDLGTGTCEARDCGAGPCTAFHLELVAEDDTQAIVHLFYDWSPIPARVLDLYLKYDLASLALEDSRGLAPLASTGKDLHTSHLSDGTLRLSVLDDDGSHPIPFGPIIELVFRRVGSGATSVAFATDDALQVSAMAPLQGNEDIQAELSDDALWGSAILLSPRADVQTRLLAWYGYESAEAPLEYEAVPDGDALCDLVSDCANEDDDVVRARLIARLDALQAGDLTADERIEGVTGDAQYFDGASDHLRLPVNVDMPLSAWSQSFSWSTWFYTEGNSPNEKPDTPQLLFSHNGYDERTGFGLRLVPTDQEHVSLELFAGDLLAKRPPPETVELVAGIPLRTWSHVGFTLDAGTGELIAYFDGEPVSAEADGTPIPVHVFEQPPNAVGCPQFFAATDVVLHDEGDVLGGRPPEFLYLGMRKSGLYRIVRMDPSGLQAKTIIGDGQYNYRDPDYSPVLDRVVFSSNQSGSYEIWMARGDGSDRRQITVGFGSAERGIVARRPRWAPDGSGIIFESNVYDVLARDNIWARVNHIYYIGFDPIADRVAVELADGSEAIQLDYGARLADQTIEDYRLTGGELAYHHLDARWLSGKDVEADRLGKIVLTRTSDQRDGAQIHTLTIPNPLPLVSTTDGPIEGLGAPDHELRLLDAFRSVDAFGTVTERIFYERGSVSYEPHDQFTFTVTPDAGGAVVRVDHTPQGYDERCWDRNFDGVEDADEDRDGDGVWDEDDCYPHEIRNLYLRIDGARQALDPDASFAGAQIALLNKEIDYAERVAFGDTYVRIEVSSPLSAMPIRAGEVASIRLVQTGGGGGAAGGEPVEIGLFERQGTTEVLVEELTDLEPPAVFDPAGVFEEVENAAFSPDGDRLVLAATTHARPVLLRTAGLATAAGSKRLVTAPLRVRGLTWLRQPRFYPCNWVGGFQHFQDKAIRYALRGGLDDTKLYAGVRAPQSFRSEAERGRDRLVQSGLDGELPTKLPSCGGQHTDCPPFHLCLEGECAMVPCDPTDPWTCSDFGGRCTLRPVSVEQEHGATPSDFDWVCASDCNSDLECFTQECLNGPCRYCEAGSLTCIECRDGVRQLGALQIAEIEGCPDRRSFMCEAGACLTECYAFEDGESFYLCDPTTEYCHQGRCVLLDWDWWDLAPASFVGGGAERNDVPPAPASGWFGTTQAVDQTVPISVTAYGVEDYRQSPELVVEVKGGPFYGAGWSRIGRVQVHNRTRAEAQSLIYHLTSPHPFDAMRLRLITAPYSNVSGAATGLGPKDVDFCVDDIAKTAALAGEDPDPTPCYRQAQGSRYNLGYRVGIPAHESIEACRARGAPGCPTISTGEHAYLEGGNPAVVVLDVEVDGGGIFNGITADRVCTYEGDLVPSESGVAKKVFYGDIADERSNERDAFCGADPAACAGGSTLADFDALAKGYALLNCNVYDPGGDSAGIELTVPPLVREWPARAGTIVLDDGDTCIVEVDAVRVEPCYAWTGDGSSLDSYNRGINTTDPVKFQSLEFGLFRSFGHDQGYQVQASSEGALRVCVSGYTLGTGLKLKNGNDTLLVDQTAIDALPGCSGNAWIFPQRVKLGHGYEVRVTGQPAGGDTCVAMSPTGVMSSPGTGALVQVVCGEAFQTVGGALAGMGPGETMRIAIELEGEGRLVARRELELTQSGPWTFGPKLQASTGMSYAVNIERLPGGQTCELTHAGGTIGQADVTNVGIVCEDTPGHVLSVRVSGLSGSGLEVLERGTNRAVAPGEDGEHALPGVFLAGQTYELVIAGHPEGPDQVCAIASGDASGAMPDEDLVAVTIECVTPPVYHVGGTVVGLKGLGLELQLGGGEIVTLDGTGELDASNPTRPFTFTTALLEGESYEVTAVTQPTAPAQTCQIAMGAGVVADADPPDVVVTCAETLTFANIRLGGAVTGLKGSGLKLQLNGGTQYKAIEANGEFLFDSSLDDDVDYDVTVKRQPSGPAQLCDVWNGVGTTWTGDGDVLDVEVVCEDAATVAVELWGASGWNGSMVGVDLISPDKDESRPAEAAPKTRIENGGANMLLVIPGERQVAPLLGGLYHAYVRVNTTNDRDPKTRLPIFGAGDTGGSKLITVEKGRAMTVRFGPSDLTPLAEAPINILPVDPEEGDIPSRMEVTCYLSPFPGKWASLPPEDESPVIAVSEGSCEDDACEDFTTDENGYVVAGKQYAARCWYDANLSDKLDTGDWAGLGIGGPAALPVALEVIP